MPAKKTDLATPNVSALALQKATAGLVERVNPKDFIAPAANDDMVAKLLANEIQDWQQLAAIFGTKSYANKAQLAEDHTTFRITRIVERVNGSYNKEDDWAFEIVTENGEVQVLSMDKNESRNTMVYFILYGLKKFGDSSPLQLQSIELAENDSRPAGRVFYTFTPAQTVTAPKNVTSFAGETIEA
jgi:hypothetical protein